MTPLYSKVLACLHANSDTCMYVQKRHMYIVIVIYNRCICYPLLLYPVKHVISTKEYIYTITLILPLLRAYRVCWRLLAEAIA